LCPAACVPLTPAIRPLWRGLSPLAREELEHSSGVLAPVAAPVHPLLSAGRRPPYGAALASWCAGRSGGACSTASGGRLDEARATEPPRPAGRPLPRPPKLAALYGDLAASEARHFRAYGLLWSALAAIGRDRAARAAGG